MMKYGPEILALVLVVILSIIMFFVGRVSVPEPAPTTEPSAAWYQCNAERSKLSYDLAIQRIELTRRRAGLE